MRRCHKHALPSGVRNVAIPSDKLATVIHVSDDRLSSGNVVSLDISANIDKAVIVPARIFVIPDNLATIVDACRVDAGCARNVNRRVRPVGIQETMRADAVLINAENLSNVVDGVWRR